MDSAAVRDEAHQCRGCSPVGVEHLPEGRTRQRSCGSVTGLHPRSGARPGGPGGSPHGVASAAVPLSSRSARGRGSAVGSAVRVGVRRGIRSSGPGGPSPVLVPRFARGCRFAANRRRLRRPSSPPPCPPQTKEGAGNLSGAGRAGPPAQTGSAPKHRRQPCAWARSVFVCEGGQACTSVGTVASRCRCGLTTPRGLLGASGPGCGNGCRGRVHCVPASLCAPGVSGPAFTTRAAPSGMPFGLATPGGQPVDYLPHESERHLGGGSS